MSRYKEAYVISYHGTLCCEVTTSQTHALPRISTRGYTQKAAVCHA